MQKKCKHCHLEFDGRPDQLFCTSICKVRHFRANHNSERLREATKVTSVKGHSKILPEHGTDMKSTLELRRIELEHEEKVLRLKIHESEKQRQREQEERERKYQHELEMTELTESRELKALRDQLKAKSLGEDTSTNQAKQEEIEKQPLVRASIEMDDFSEGDNGKENDTLLTLGVLGIGALLFFKLSGGNKNNQSKPTQTNSQQKSGLGKKGL